MGINTLVKAGIIYKMDVPVTILDLPKHKGNFAHNPSIARDKDGKIWLSIRSNTINTKKNLGLIGDGPNPPRHYTNHLYVGQLDEKTLKVSNMKEIVPSSNKPFMWGIEDVRIFWRDDELHGIGVVVNTEDRTMKVGLAEILIDHKKGVYTLIEDFGQPLGHTEKNWSPPESATRLFDFTYSPTQIYIDGRVIGHEYDGQIHGGSQLLPYKDGYISIAHEVMLVGSEKHYVSVAILSNAQGFATHVSQLWHLDVGWRDHLKESVEFISGAVWSDGSLLVSLGVKDVMCGVAKIPISKFNWQGIEDVHYYTLSFNEEPNKDEIEPDLSLISSGAL